MSSTRHASSWKEGAGTTVQIPPPPPQTALLAPTPNNSQASPFNPDEAPPVDHKPPVVCSMASRPRRSAAQKATEAITDMADRDAAMSSRSRRSVEGRGSAAHDSSAMHLTVKVPASKLRQATTGGRGPGSALASAGGSRRPTRGAKKRYIESDSDEDEDEEQDVIKVGEDDEEDEAEDEETPEQDEEDDEMEDLGDEDAEGDEVDDDDDDDMEVDADGEDDEDADGDVDMDVTPAPPPPTIKISKPGRNQPLPASAKARTSPATSKKPAPVLADDDDEELSELDSDVEDEINDTVRVGGQEVGDEDAEGELEEEDVDVDAEGEEIEVADEDGVELDSDEDGSRAGTPDLSKMTRRQRARFEEEPQEYMKLSDGKSRAFKTPGLL